MTFVRAIKLVAAVIAACIVALAVAGCVDGSSRDVAIIGHNTASVPASSTLVFSAFSGKTTTYWKITYERREAKSTVHVDVPLGSDEDFDISPNQPAVRVDTGLFRGDLEISQTSADAIIVKWPDGLNFES
jgi:hypothetical protein